MRRIIEIDEQRCNGCGACAAACHEGAIAMVDGRAPLIRDDYCDGLGDCLPACPVGAIRFVEREAAEYDVSVAARRRKEKNDGVCSCPGTTSEYLGKESSRVGLCEERPSCLLQWPCQIKLVPVKASFYDGRKLLIAATCTAYAYASMHEKFMDGAVTLVGCPKLDGVDYSEKLAAIIGENDFTEISLVRMEVPCCRGLELALDRALERCGGEFDVKESIVSTDGKIL